jgi:hypothetical protein
MRLVQIVFSMIHKLLRSRSFERFLVELHAAYSSEPRPDTSCSGWFRLIVLPALKLDSSQPHGFSDQSKSLSLKCRGDSDALKGVGLQ